MMITKSGHYCHTKTLHKMFVSLNQLYSQLKSKHEDVPVLFLEHASAVLHHATFIANYVLTQNGSAISACKAVF